ncbi:hypothetical protein GCM10022276_03080 [Sphingomonas limnosediminicola]|uniref:Peptidase S1 domain-containing protein n=2 Tax=Sphingomonas limnosediminicola TaxID=940133 RepID=A0ABP7KW80_9SPHN
MVGMGTWLRSSVSRLALPLAAVLYGALGSPAGAVLTRTDYSISSGNPNYARYVNLANQQRFYAVGELLINVPFEHNTSAGKGCTGSMISANLVLTAAHCMFAYDAAKGTVVSVFTPGLVAKGGTFDNGASVTLIGGPSEDAYQYAAQIDAVSIYPGYDGATAGSGDIALVRLGGKQTDGMPTSPDFLSVFTGTNEATIDPSFAVTIGYGNLGNGTAGEIAGSSGLKLAGLTEVDYSADANVLKSTFLSPGAIFSRGYPSNFLQAAPAHGDSGGPLVVGNTIIGVVSGGPGETPLLFDPSGGGDLYGEVNYWTRVSSFASWIASESIALGAAPPATVSGNSTLNPLVVAATLVAPDTYQKNFSFLGTGGFTYLDPSTGSVDDFIVSNGPLIAALSLDSIITNSVEIWTFDEMLGNYVNTGDTITGGGIYTFANAVDRFRLVGLGGQTTTVGLSFVQPGLVQLDWISHLISDDDGGGGGGGGGNGGAVPEPSTWAMLLLGFGALGRALRRHRKELGMRPSRI